MALPRITSSMFSRTADHTHPCFDSKLGTETLNGII